MSFTSSLPAMSLAVVGIEFDNRDGSNRRFAMALCGVGDSVELRLEPDNPADENAVAVYTTAGLQLGYITSIRAVRISSILRAGREVQAVLQGKAKFGAWIRVAFDGEAPTLPDSPNGAHDESAAPESDFEPDFYPDEVWPDD